MLASLLVLVGLSVSKLSWTHSDVLPAPRRTVALEQTRDTPVVSAVPRAAVEVAASLPAHIASPTPQPEPARARPNVLVMLADDLRADLGYQGRAASTPHLDALARRSVRFERAHAQATTCNPSRNSLWTGRRPDTTFVWGFENTVGNSAEAARAAAQAAGSSKSPYPWTSFAGYFRAHDYYTVSVGKTYHWPDANPITREAFENLDGSQDFWDRLQEERRRMEPSFYAEKDRAPETFLDGVTATRCSRELERQRTATRPFFLACGFSAPHEPLRFPYNGSYYQTARASPKLVATPHPYLGEGTPPWAVGDLWDTVSFPKEGAPWENRAVRSFVSVPPKSDFTPTKPLPTDALLEFRRGYTAAIGFLDCNVGRVLGALESSGHAANTLVVFTSDHGFSIGDHGGFGKRSLFETDTRVPLLIADPRHPATHGKSASTFFELIDLMPTVAVLAGLPDPSGNALSPRVDGQDLSKALRTPAALLKQSAISQDPRCPPRAFDTTFLTLESHPGRIQCGVKLYVRDPLQMAAGDTHGTLSDRSNEFRVMMGYSRRSTGWRYTAWVLWHAEGLRPDFQQVVDEELYSHPDNVTGAESSYDAQEARNLARDPAFSSVVASQRARLRAEVEAYHSAWPGRGAVAQRIRSVACKGGYKQAC